MQTVKPARCSSLPMNRTSSGDPARPWKSSAACAPPASSIGSDSYPTPPSMPSTSRVPKLILRNARAWAPRTSVRWLAVVAAFSLALILRLALHDHFGPRYPLVFFTVATLIVHFFFGLLPAVVLALGS